jgi:hypothetical protein
VAVVAPNLPNRCQTSGVAGEAVQRWARAYILNKRKEIMMRMYISGNNNKNLPWWVSGFEVDQKSWGDIATYVCKIAPEITAGCKWHANDGHGLNADDSILLADLLQKEIESGGAMNYAVEVLDPYELCYDCAPFPGPTGDPTCPSCNGDGFVPSAEKRQLFVLTVRHFANFLRGCGGFRFGTQHERQHEEDLRALQWQWEASCASAREEFQSTLQQRCV